MSREMNKDLIYNRLNTLDCCFVKNLHETLGSPSKFHVIIYIYIYIYIYISFGIKKAKKADMHKT